jgi:ribosomal protein S18 acetylase RimI-like enzyme
LTELENQVAGSWYLNAMATHPDARGRGLGNLMLDLVHTWAQDQGATQISLVVERSNIGAVALYERKGWHVIEERDLAAAEGLPESVALLMVKSVRRGSRTG